MQTQRRIVLALGDQHPIHSPNSRQRREQLSPSSGASKKLPAPARLPA
jgi:hypothetical protein